MYCLWLTGLKAPTNYLALWSIVKTVKRWRLAWFRHVTCHGSGMSHATTVCPKPSSGTSWRMDDAMVSRGNAGWTTSKRAYPCPYWKHLQGPPPEKTGRGYLRYVNCPSCPPDDPISQGTEPNWTELWSMLVLAGHCPSLRTTSRMKCCQNMATRTPLPRSHRCKRHCFDMKLGEVLLLLLLLFSAELCLDKKAAVKVKFKISF